MQGLTERAQRFNDAHKKDQTFGNINNGALQQYRYPLEGEVDGQPVTISHLADITGMSICQLCTDSQGVQTWVPIQDVRNRDRNYLARQGTSQLVGAGGSNR